MKQITRSATQLTVVAILGVSILFSGCDRLGGLTDEEHVQRAKKFLAEDDLRTTEIELKNAIGKNPSNAEARWLLGDVHIENGQGAAAEKELQRARELGVGAESLKVPLAKSYLQQAKYKEVLDEINIGPQSTARVQAQIQKLRGDALLGLRQGQDACDLYSQSNQTDATYVDVYSALALCAVALNQDSTKAQDLLARGLGLVEDALQKAPTEFEMLMLKGELLKAMGKPEEAIAAFADALKIRPSHFGANLQLASFEIEKKNWDKARAHVAEARRTRPQGVDALYLSALIDYRRGNLAQARDTALQALKLAPGHLPTLTLYGTVSLSLGAFEQAERSLSSVLARSPRSNHVRKLLAATLLKQGNASLALETLTPILSQDADFEVLGLAGEAYMALKKPKEAARYFELAAVSTPQNAAVRTELGVSRLMAGDVQSGLTDLEKATQMDPKQTQADGVLIMTYINLRQYDKALQAIDVLEKKQPDSAVVHNLRGGVYLSKRDIANARKSFEKALAIDPTLMSAAKNLAQLDLMDKRPSDARKRFHDVLAKDKNDIDAMLALADLAKAEGNDADYLQWVTKAGKTSPKAIEPQARLIKFHLTRKEPRKALSIARDVQNANPNNAQAWELLGRTQLEIGDAQNAITSFNKATKLEPGSARSIYYQGLAQAASGNMRDARVSFSNVLQLNGAHIDARKALVALELKQNRGTEALRLAEELSQARPQSAVGPTMEGDVLMAQKKYLPAARAYERAFKLDSTAPLAITIQQSLLHAGSPKAGDDVLKSWLNDHPNDVATRVFFADSLRARGDNRAAIGHYELALQKAPNNVSILNNLALAYGSAKDARALATAQRAHQLAPDHPGVQDTLGWILLDANQIPKALEILKKAATKAPESGTIRYHYAVALARAGKKAEARKELETAIASDKKFRELADAKALLQGL